MNTKVSTTPICIQWLIMGSSVKQSINIKSWRHLGSGNDLNMQAARSLTRWFIVETIEWNRCWFIVLWSYDVSKGLLLLQTTLLTMTELITNRLSIYSLVENFIGLQLCHGVALLPGTFLFPFISTFCLYFMI